MRMCNMNKVTKLIKRCMILTGLPVLLSMALISSGSAGMFDVFNGDSDQKLVIVFVDISGSPTEKDWKIYTDTFESLIKTGGKSQIINAGDRVVLSQISEQTIADFSPYLDQIVEKENKVMRDRKHVKKASENLQESFVSLKQEKRAKLTRILDMLNIAEEIFAKDSDRKDKWIIFLSDMVEESTTANFAKKPVSDKFTKEFISHRKEYGLLPDLTGVKVYVAGAGGSKGKSSAKKFYDTRSFWLAYFEATGAKSSESMYGRTAIRTFK